MATVTKPFNTRLQRFGKDDPVSPKADLRPLSFEQLVKSGHIEVVPDPAPVRPKRRRKP